MNEAPYVDLTHSPVSPRSRPKVLVLCQRKRDTGADGEMVRFFGSRLKRYTKQMWPGSQATLEYMSNVPSQHYPHGIADFSLYFGDNAETDQFIDDHRHYYDMVIGHQCPVRDLDGSLLSAILKPDGYLSLLTFHPNPSAPEYRSGHYRNDFFQPDGRLLAYFVPARSPVDPQDPFFFIKRAR